MRIPRIDYNILVLAPFGPIPETGHKVQLYRTDLSTLDEALEAISPQFYVSIPQALCPQGGLTLAPKCLADFKPDRMVKNDPYLSQLKEAAREAEAGRSSGQSAADICSRIQTRFPGLPLDYSAAAAPQTKAASAVDDILSMVAMPGGSEAAADSAKAAGSVKDQVDRLLSSLLNLIFSHPEFRACETAWKGLRMMAKQGAIKEGDGFSLTLACLNEAVLPTVFEELVPLVADNPPHLILVDSAFSNSPRSLELMEKTAELADNLLTPTVCWIDYSFFGLGSWNDLGKINYIKHYLDNAAYAKWRKLREHPGSNWLTVTLNRSLERLPYGRKNPSKGVAFEESEPMWLPPVYALGALTAQSLNIYGWPSRFTDYAHVALKELTVADLPGHESITTETTLSDDRIFEFVEAGFTPLLGPLRKDSAFMPKEATVAGGSLKYQMFTSRVLTFLFWCRDNLADAIGSDNTATNLEQAFRLFWENTGHPAPKDLSITVREDPQAGPVLDVSLTPPPSLLPGSQRLDFSFRW